MMHLRVRSETVSRTTNDENAGVDEAHDMSAVFKPGNLLRTPMAELVEKVNERRVIARSLATAAMEERINQEAEAAVKELEHPGVEVTSGGTGQAGKTPVQAAGSAVGAGEALWVDKYAPKGFRDLLSDERINREVLRAVKGWDQFVFKKVSVFTLIKGRTHRGGFITHENNGTIL